MWLDKEGTDIALWLSEQGITCMVVKYRTNRRKEKRKFAIDMEMFFTIGMAHAQDNIVSIHPKIGDTISLSEKINFKLFPH